MTLTNLVATRLEIESAEEMSEPKLSLEEICRIEPEVRALLREASAPDPRCDGCRMYGYGEDVKYGGFREDIYRLVGWHCERPELQTMHAFNTVYRAVHELLPENYGTCPVCS